MGNLSCRLAACSLLSASLLAAACGCGKSESTPAGGQLQIKPPGEQPRASEPAAPPLQVTSDDLAKEFRADRKAALQKYGGKTVEIRGTVQMGLKEDFGGGYRVMLQPPKDDPGATVVCFFTGRAAAPATTLSQGQAVTVKGRVDPQSSGMVMLANCELQAQK